MRRPALALALSVPLLLLAGPSPVRAQESAGVTVTQVGWWSSRPTAVAQPGQGFEVAAGPQGDAQSVAAIRLSIAATHVDTLQVHLVEGAGGSIGAELGTLKVCTTRDTWTAANPGKLADAPKPDCSVSATLTRTTDGSWLGDLTALARDGGEVSLMIVPLYQPPAPVGPGMVVTIASGEFAATGTNATTTTESSPDSGGGGTTDQPPADLYGSFGGGSFDGGTYDNGSFIVPAEGGGADLGATTTTTVAAATETHAGTDDFALTPVAAGGEGAAPWIRLVLLIPLCSGFGVGVVLLRRMLAVRGVLPAA